MKDKEKRKTSKERPNFKNKQTILQVSLRKNTYLITSFIYKFRFYFTSFLL